MHVAVPSFAEATAGRPATAKQPRHTSRSTTLRPKMTGLSKFELVGQAPPYHIDKNNPHEENPNNEIPTVSPSALLRRIGGV